MFDSLINLYILILSLWVFYWSKLISNVNVKIAKTTIHYQIS